MTRLVEPGESTTRREFVGRLAAGVALSGLRGNVAPLLAAEPSPSRSGRARSYLEGAEALFVVLADTHSAYDRYPQIVAMIDALRARRPGVPMAILFNGDLFERGNVVALRGQGRVDLAFLDALLERAPVVFNLGNHEAALADLAHTTDLLAARGARVVSNVADVRSDRLLTAASTTLELGTVEAAVAGIATDDLATYRAAARPALRIPEPTEYAAAHLPALLGNGGWPIVLSHAGTLADRRLARYVPDGALVVGGHDHLRYAHRAGRSLYLHTGAWGEALAIAGVRGRWPDIEWQCEMLPLNGATPADLALATLVAAEEDRHLNAADLAVLFSLARELTVEEAARLAAAALREAAAADVGLIGNTTFGAALPAGPVSRYRFDAFLRFDGGLQRAEVDGAALARILGRANQAAGTPFAERTGEFLFAAPVLAPEPDRRYTIATHDWVVTHADRYLGFRPAFEPLPPLRLKAVVAEWFALQHA